MEWLSQNWVFLLVAVAFIAMHLFGHGGHGGHDRRPGNDDDRRDDSRAPPSGGGHRH